MIQLGLDNEFLLLEEHLTEKVAHVSFRKHRKTLCLPYEFYL